MRRLSHLKVCELKDKMATMVPGTDEYSQFGRNTKLLLHPKDVPDLQFSSKTERKGEIPPEVEISLIHMTSSTDLVEKSDEISPQLLMQPRSSL